MRSRRVAGALAVTGVLLALAVPTVQGATAPPRTPSSCRGSHWVAAWTAAPQSSSLGRPDDVELGLADGPARSFDDQSLRMIVTPHAAGPAIRVHLSNCFGVEPLTIGTATLGIRANGASLVPGTVRDLRFAGGPGVSIAPGDDAISDPLFVRVRPLQDLAVSFHVPAAAVLDYHQWAQGTNYVTPMSAGDHADDERGAAYTEEITSSYGVTAVDVLAPSSVGAVVALGDSITDGIGSSPNTSRRWPDQLARRLVASAANLTVVNAGIAGNHVATSGLTSLHAIGPSAQERLSRDALSQAGVTDIFVFEGINDIFMSDTATDVAAKVIAGYRSIIADGHAAGVRVVGSTITPAAMSGAKEAARQAVNRWIRTSGQLDGVVDFDAVARDPAAPSTVRPGYDAAMAHLNDAGYRALANAVDLSMFQGTGCPS